MIKINWLCANYGKMKNKKGQMKIQQMAFMLIAVTVFFVLIGLFALAFGVSSVKQSATSEAQENAKNLVTKLANSAEFACGDSFFNEENCIDFDKALILERNSEFYDGFWDVAEISIRKIYPESETDVECTQVNYPNCNVLTVYSQNIDWEDESFNFVSLCRKEALDNDFYDKCEMGLLLIKSKSLVQNG